MDPLDQNAPAETVVGPSVKIKGDLNSEGNIRIEGGVAGKVKTTQSVHVGEAAKLQADVSAGNAVVAGEILGNMKIASSLILLATARVSGDISCGTLRVEDGAQYTGKCTMSNAPGGPGETPEKEKAPTKNHRSAVTVSVAEPEPES